MERGDWMRGGGTIGENYLEEYWNHTCSSLMGLGGALGKWKFLSSTQPRPCLLSLPSSTSNLLMSSSVWAASLAHPHPHPRLLHLKRDCVSDLNWVDDEYALCVTENSFKAKGALLTSLRERRQWTQAMKRRKWKASAFGWNFKGHSWMMAHQATFCLSYLIAFTCVPMETAASWKLLGVVVMGLFYHLFSRGLVPLLHAQFEWTVCDTAISWLGLGGQASQT